MDTNTTGLPILPNTRATTFQVTPPVPFRRLEKTITDPLTPGKEYAFDLGFYPVPSQADAMYLTEKTAELVRVYVNGENESPAKAVMSNGGGRVPISQTLCLHVATLMLAEYSVMSTATRTADDWFKFAIEAPNAWRELLTWWYAETKQKPATAAEEGTPLPNV